MTTKYKVIKTQNGYEVWDGIAFEPDSLVFKTRAEAQAVADDINRPWGHKDESAGSVLTGREWD